MKRVFGWRIMGLMLSISALSGVGCGDAAPRAEWETRERLLLVPPNRTVEQSESFQLAVERVQGGQSENLTARTAWTLSDPTIAEVSSTGLLIATRPGTSRITAQVDGLTATTLVFVLGRPIDIQLSPGMVRIVKGTSTRLSATIISEDNTKREMSGHEAWASSDVRVARASEGTVEGVAPGQATISLVSREQIFSRQVQVLDVALESIVPATSLVSPIVVGQSTSLFADGRFAGGHEQDVRPYVEFRLVDEQNSPVSLAGGSITALKPGRAVIDVVGREGSLAAGKRAQLTVDVLEAPTSIELVGPTKASLRGEPFAVHVNGTTGTATRDVSSLATITAEPAGIVRISGTTITPLKAGEVKLTAQVNAGGLTRQSSRTISVTDAPFSDLDIHLPDGNTGSLAVGGMLRLAGVASFGPDITQAVTRQVLWLSDHPSVAFVDNAAATSGSVVGLSEGTAIIKAYYRGQEVTSTTITVTP